MKHILALALMALSIMVQGQEKILVDTTTNGNKFYIYPSTIKRGSYGITVWTEAIYAKPQLDKRTNKYYTSSKIQQLIDCDGYRISVIAFTDYSKNVNIVNSRSRSEYKAYSELAPLAPGSVGWRTIEETCKRYNRGY